MKKSMIIIGMFLLAVTASKAQDTKPAEPAPNPNAAEFKFETEEYNFGTIKQGDVVNYNFDFTNVGKDPLIITSASGSCGCTVPSYSKDPVKKGEKSVIKVTFNSAGKMGMQDKTVTLQSNAKIPTKVLHLKGTVVEKEKPATPAAAPAK